VWPEISAHLQGLAFFAGGFLLATILAAIRLPHRSRDINPVVKPRAKTRVEADAAVTEAEKLKDKRTDQGIAEYEKQRRRPPQAALGEEDLRRIHQLETSKPFTTDMQCPECKATALAGWRVVIHNRECSKTQELERLV
jgi:hypothetical protein